MAHFGYRFWHNDFYRWVSLPKGLFVIAALGIVIYGKSFHIF